MKNQANAILILFSLVATISGVQCRTKNQSSAKDTQVRGYWVDPSTGLMWAGKENGEAVTWRKAVSYCHKLRLAGYSNWRLPTLDELATLVDKSASTSERTGNTETFTVNVGRHVRGNLSLAGDPWSSNRNYFFDFVNSKPSSDLPYIRNTKYALCVRGPGP